MLNKILIIGAFIVGFSVSYIAAPAWAQEDGDDNFEFLTGIEEIQQLVIDEALDRAECDEKEASKQARKAHKALKHLAQYFRKRINKRAFVADVLSQMEEYCSDEGIDEDDPEFDDPEFDDPEFDEPGLE